MIFVFNYTGCCKKKKTNTVLHVLFLKCANIFFFPVHLKKKGAFEKVV